eukprot:TRINITY_DN70558_c0_g1_i1.p2 TRINITY_DN70558_c0_g1~~TRINITY_DN70558_c0_g1_i1.p2  ORF type:complete len:110 (-),score=48.27 TRINITY_DN70558_c0_g1_i1:10-300(-)
MANVDGNWNTVTKSPMGDQAATLTITSSGDGFTGNYSGPMGSVPIRDGKIDGNKLTWALDITVPMPMTLTAEALVDEIGRAVQQECRDRSRMPSSA